MNDVFDEELIKELGLDPEDIHGPKERNAKRPIRPAAKTPVKVPAKATQPPEKKPVQPQAPEPQAPEPKAPAAPQPAKPKVPETLEDQATRISQDIPVHLAAVLAKKSVKLKDILELKTGEVLEFKKLPQEPLDLVANGKLIAKAELVLIDGKIGARIVKLIK